uniref:NR LBD domain-containing protein n=1 Tax=Caenorhabditis tropicalis TaxID=1561998 RepID=A0A1I7U3Y5_9PELO
MSANRKQPKTTLKPTGGVTDFASQYKAIISDKEKLIDSAKYFMRMRKSHLTEVLSSYDEFVDDISYEQAAIILNEFLSPTCSLLEFEYRNLTKAGRDESESETSGPPEEPNEIWQKQILGRVLTHERHATFITLPANASHMFEEEPKKVDKSKEERVNDRKNNGESSSDCQTSLLEIFTIYRKIHWFIKNVDVNEFTMSRFTRNDIRKGINDFKSSYEITSKAVTCLVYLEIIEKLRTDPANTVDNVFAKCNRMMLEERNGEFSQETIDMLKCANLFILKYYGGSDDDTLFRRGFGYLSTKLKALKENDKTHPHILGVSACLASEELKIAQVYDFLCGVYDFSNFKL